MQRLVTTCQETFTTVELKTVTTEVGASLGTVKVNFKKYIFLVCHYITNRS